jgi:HEAT repeat protein
MRTPLIMTFAYGLSLEGHLSARVSLRALYNQVVFSLLEGAWRTKVGQLMDWRSDVIGRERVGLFLRELVWPLFLALSGLNRFSLTDWTTAWDRAAAAGEAPEINRDQLVRDLYHLGLLVDGGMNEAGHPCWSFAHRTVLEFLVADYLVDGSSSAKKQALLTATGWRALIGSISAQVKRWLAKPSPLDWVLYTKCPFWNAPEWQQVLVFLAGMLPEPRRLLEAIQIRINSGKEDVFRSAYSLQKELLFAMPTGAGGDDFARHLAKKWLERWSTVLAYRDELLEAPEYPRRQPVPDRTLISLRVVHARLLGVGCRISEQPVAAEEMIGFLTELLLDGKLDAVRRQQLERFQKLDRKVDPDSVNFTFAATVEKFHARILETLGELSSHLGSNSAFNRACATLAKVLQSDQEPETLRVTAAARLRKFPTEAAVDALLCGLENSKEWTIREASAESLGQIGAMRAVPALLAALAPDRENGGALRFVSAHALGVIGSEEAIPGLRAALELRQPEEESQQERRVKSTTAQEIEAASKELLNRFYDSMVPLRAANALRKINSDKAAIALLETLRANPDAKVASDLALVLSDIKSDSVFECFRVAADSSNHQPESYRETAIRCLARMQDPRCGPLLRHVLEREPEEPESVRIAAVEALGDLALDEGIAPLSRVLGSLEASGGLREAAAAALGKIGSDAAAQALRSALPCPNESLLNAIFLALGEIRCPTSLAYFREAVQPIHHVSLRILAAEALGKIASDAAVDELLDALEPMELGSDGKDDGLEWIRMNRLRDEAAIALGRIGSEKAIPGLLVALSPSRSHRSNADERELKRFEAIESVRTITRESVHEDWKVRLSAALALRHIGLKCAQREVLGSLVQSLLVILNSHTEDHAGVRIATRESLQAICAEHRLQIPATPQFPSFQDVTIF